MIWLRRRLVPNRDKMTGRMMINAVDLQNAVREAMREERQERDRDIWDQYFFSPTGEYSEVGGDRDDRKGPTS